MNMDFKRMMLAKYKPLKTIAIYCFLSSHLPLLSAAQHTTEPVQACILAHDIKLNDHIRQNIADCLGWQTNNISSICHGYYQPIVIHPLLNQEIQIKADTISFYQEQTSNLSGHVEVQQDSRQVVAKTAYIYRDLQSHDITAIKLLDNVTYLEAEHFIVAKQVDLNPQDKSGQAYDVIYRFNTKQLGAALPAWGRARLINRFANKNYTLTQATYSVCAPKDNTWHISAQKISLNNADETGEAINANLYLGDFPVLYAPYLSFPTSKKRKSGLLLPIIGSSNTQGFNISLPYYWNIAPNYDATIIPHVFSKRGVMLGGQFRYLTEQSKGNINADFLPYDNIYRHYIADKAREFPSLVSANHNASRWFVAINDVTQLGTDLRFDINYQQVSDNYYFEDFSNNFALLTDRQLLQQADLVYASDHWLLKAMLQSYQTLKPVNDDPITDIYERLPQLSARGHYTDLPFNANVVVLGQYDQFHWPNHQHNMPEGARFYLNPVLSFDQSMPWGYVTPAVEWVQNYYDLTNKAKDLKLQLATRFNNTRMRYSVDSGLYFDKQGELFQQKYTQILEPRLFYLYVPYRDQSIVPSFDSAYMIFNIDQMFRTNRFSGFDRIGDSNQLSYALTSRWLMQENGMEKIMVGLGQIYYFQQRHVQLCQSLSNIPCFDTPLMLGYLAPNTRFSPITSRFIYHVTPEWQVTSDYSWDTNTHKTNNGYIDFHYQSGVNQQVSVGYTYLVNGDLTQVAFSKLEDNALHQATFSYAWPLSLNWSTLGALNYNLSKHYKMMSLFGVQYDSCCWAVRLLGGHAFKSLNEQLQPKYNTNVYLQVLLKGLTSIGNNDPASIIRTFIPGYVNSFHRV